jgi:membrane associated rhomboid family serine protease
MVGASGGIFGMLGTMKRWEWRFLREHGLPKRRFWTTVIVFALINVVLSFGSGIAGGGIAWEAHLGGFVVGWLAGGFVTPRNGAWVGPI